MKYTIIIKNNETGEEVINQQCDAIVGGIAENEHESGSICVTDCNGVQLFGTICAAIDSIKKSIDDTPLMLKTMIKIAFEKAADELKE